MPKVTSTPGLPVPEPKMEPVPDVPVENQVPAVSTGRKPYVFKAGGQTIVMGPPPLPTVILLPAILATLKGNNSEALYNEMVIRAALYIRSIDGKPVTHPTEFGEVQRIVTQLGEEGADAMMQVYEQRFIPPRVEVLDDLKK